MSFGETIYQNESVKVANRSMSAEPTLQTLELQIDDLIQLCQQLAEENHQLRERHTQLISERDALLAKNALASTRIEAMIVRLKSMEIDT